MIAQPDISERFIPPPDAPLAANLAALWACEPTLAQAIEELPEDSVYPVEISKSGLPTLSLRTADGRAILLHSRHQPADEGRRLVEAVAIEEKMTFYVLGLGLGYHLEALFQRASEEAIFCVFEPDLRMIRTALQHRDLSDLLRSNRIMWFNRAHKADVFRRLTPHTALISVGFETITHAPSLQLHDAFFRQFEIWLGEFAAFCRTNMNTLVINSRKTAENICRNCGWYAATAGLGRLRDRHKNQPAVVIAAGPSLRKNKHLLKGLDNNAILIAVQTSLQPMLEMGVQPHFVTSLDYHEICTRFFEKLPASIRTELIAESKATPAIFQMMTGPTTLLGNDFAEGLLREAGLKKPALTASATVAHLAYYLAQYMGCDPIIFIGQDLGFSDGLCYAPGTSYEDVWRPELSRFCTVEMKQWEQIIRERPILRKIPDYRGRPMYTEERLFSYLHQFEQEFAKSSARIIDATEGGAAKRHTTPMPLAQAIEQFCAKPLAAIHDPPPPPRWSVLESCLQSVRNRKDEAIEVVRISRQTLPLLEEIRDHLDDQPRVNRAIARIDELRAKMESQGRTYEMITQFSQESELRRFRADRKLAAARLTGADRQLRQVQRDIDNVEAVIAAAEPFEQMMDEMIHRLAIDAARHKEAA